MSQAEAVRIEADDLIPRLISEFGFAPNHARRVAQRLAMADASLKRAFLRWWQTGDVDNTIEVAGYTVQRLVQERGMTPLSAYSTLELLWREPTETLRALKKGHDTVIPRTRPVALEMPGR